jgi:hypothetical protein
MLLRLNETQAFSKLTTKKGFVDFVTFVDFVFRRVVRS